MFFQLQDCFDSFPLWHTLARLEHSLEVQSIAALSTDHTSPPTGRSHLCCHKAWDGVSAETELHSLFTSDPEGSFQRMVDLASEKGVALTVVEVKGFLKQMDEESEFDDIELDPIVLTAVAGRSSDGSSRGMF